MGIGIYFLLTMGYNTRILNSNEYKIFYNKTDSQYYLLTDDSLNLVNVSLYLPNRVKNITIYHYNLENELLDKKEVKKNDNIQLNTYKDDYYIIESKYSKNKKDKIKVAVYHTSDIVD